MTTFNIVIKLISKDKSFFKIKLQEKAKTTSSFSKTDKLSMRQEDNRDFIKETLCKNTINFKVAKSNDILETIYKYIKEKNIDMLVMVNTRHSFLENIIFQSTIDELSLNLNIPLLALQNMKRDEL